MFLLSDLEVSLTSTSFITLHLLVSDIAKCIGLSLFYKNCIVYYNVNFYYRGVFIEKYVYTKFRPDWLLLG